MKILFRTSLLIALSLGLCAYNIIYGQPNQDDIGPSSYEVQIIPENPDVAQLDKFGDLPVNKYNGTANFSIPIHAINFDGLSIPISLTYNTGGIRVNQDASWVGLGWSLNEGFTITRDVNGFDDLNSYVGAQKSEGWIYSKNYFEPVAPYYLQITDADLLSLDQGYDNNLPEDTEPDLFTVSLPGGSVKFYLPKIVGTETELIGQNMGEANDKVVFDITNKTFTVTDDKGFIYEFTEKEFSTGYASWEKPPSDVGSRTTDPLTALNAIPSWSTNQTEMMIKSWKVSRITSPMGRELQFNYVDGFFMSFPHFSETYDNYSISVNNSRSTTVNMSTPPLLASISAFHVRYLSGISGDFGSLDFNLGTRDDLYSKEAHHRLISAMGSSSAWNPGVSPNTYNGKRLDSINIKDPNDKPIKTATFQYSYFNSNRTSWQDREKYIRLKLDGITIQDKEYSFDYHNPDGLPDKDTKSVDFWGFYNGVSNNLRIPTYNRFQRVQASAQNSYEGFEAYVKLNGANRKSDINYGKYGILTKVTYPTGGSTEFEYEGNSVTLPIPSYTPSFNGQGELLSSTVSDSKAYNFRYQQLKLANDTTFRFEDNSNAVPCTTGTFSKGTNSPFDIDYYDFCDNAQTYNISISATLSCTVGCNQGINPTGTAVWIENTATGQIYNIFSYDNQFDVNNTVVNLQHTMTLPLGNYELKSTSWSVTTPFLVVATATASATIYEDTTPIPVNLDGYEEFEVGGARIVKLVNKDTDGTVTSTRKYTYEELIDGSLLSSGKLMDDLVFGSSMGGSFEYSPEQVGMDSYRITMHSDNRVRANPSAAGSHVGYSRVIEESLDSANSPNGQIEALFTNIENEYFSRYIGCTYAVLGNCSACSFNFECFEDKGALSCAEMQSECFVQNYDQVIYGDVYQLNGPVISHDHLNGNVIQETIKDVSGNAVSATINSYQELTSGSYPFSFYAIMNRVGGTFPFAAPYLRISTSELKNNRFSKLISTTKIDYFDTEDISSRTDYYYQGSGHYYLTKTETTGSDGKTRIMKAYYPEDLSSDPFMSDLITANRLNTVIISESYINPDGTSGLPDELLNTQTTHYNDNHNAAGIVLPENVTTEKVSLGAEERILYEQYDDHGNMLQYKKPDGMTVAFIWGYNDMYPLAKIENATYAQVSSQVSNLKALSNADVDRSKDLTGTEGALRTALESLRASLPDALVTTFTFDPLIGMTSMTGPNGYSVYYDYDSSNRLKTIVDGEGKIVSENEYNYKQ